MSIHNLLDKIKAPGGIDRQTILFLFIVVCVGLGAFGLGRLSVTSGSVNGPAVQILDEGSRGFSASSRAAVSKGGSTSVVESSPSSGAGEMYVASKNGKLYYTRGCSGAKRIAVKNQVWFATAHEAQEAGYTLSTSCK